MRRRRSKGVLRAGGFTLIELLITVSILGILAGLTLVSFARNWEDERLKAASRETSAWLDEVRQIAIQQSLPCRISVNGGTAELSLQPNPDNPSEFCAQNLKGSLALRTAVSNNSDLQLCSTSLNGADPTGVALDCATQASSTTSVVFTPRGTASSDVLIKLQKPKASKPRCIAVLAPMGQIRSGKATETGCDFTTAF